MLFGLAIWLVVRVHRGIAARFSARAERQLQRLPGGAVIARIADAQEGVRRTFFLVCLAVAGPGLHVGHVFPPQVSYTRAWGESLRSGLISTVGSMGRGVVDQLPNLVVLVIFIVTRFLVRMANVAFQAAEQDRVVIPGLYPETAQPTRRIVVAIAMAVRADRRRTSTCPAATPRRSRASASSWA